MCGKMHLLSSTNSISSGRYIRVAVSNGITVHSIYLATTLVHNLMHILIDMTLYSCTVQVMLIIIARTAKYQLIT